MLDTKTKTGVRETTEEMMRHRTLGAGREYRL
jgi:hypothetical protein